MGSLISLILELFKRKFWFFTFGKSMVWESKIKEVPFLQQLGVFNPDGGLYRIEKDRMVCFGFIWHRF
jgi:hypothetical protein